MALATTELDRCAVCRRHFLQGEAIRLFREPQSRGMQRVCPLCTGSAEHRGWELCEATREIPLRSHGDPARAERAVQRDRLIERLQEQLEGAQRERDGLRQAGERKAAELSTEVQRLRHALAGESDQLATGRQAAELQDRRLERAERRQRELEAELGELREELGRVMRARRREADTAYLRRIAAEAFNRSEHADAVAAIAPQQGAPRCRVAVDGVMLPRRVAITLAWGEEARSYRVELDLVERSANVEPLRVERGAIEVRANAAWTPANGVIADA